MSERACSKASGSLDEYYSFIQSLTHALRSIDPFIRSLTHSFIQNFCQRFLRRRGCGYFSPAGTESDSGRNIFPTPWHNPVFISQGVVKGDVQGSWGRGGGGGKMGGRRGWKGLLVSTSARFQPFEQPHALVAPHDGDCGPLKTTPNSQQSRTGRRSEQKSDASPSLPSAAYPFAA